MLPLWLLSHLELLRLGRSFFFLTALRFLSVSLLSLAPVHVEIVAKPDNHTDRVSVILQDAEKRQTSEEAGE